MATRTLPPRPSLEHLKNQAKALLKAHQAGDAEVCLRLRDGLPRFSRSSEDDILRAKVSLGDAQQVIAREYGYTNWRALRTHVSPGGRPRRIEAIQRRIAAEFDLHPPSGRVAFTRWDEASGEISALLADTLTGEASPPISSSIPLQIPRFSPDGSRIAFCGDGRIHLYSIDDGGIQTVVDMPGWDARFAEWSPDGESLVFQAVEIPLDAGKGNGLFRLDLLDGKTERLTAQDAGAMDMGPQWDPSGTMLAFGRRLFHDSEEQFTIVITNMATSEERALPFSRGGRQSISRFPWSRDGRYLMLQEADEHGRQNLKLFRTGDLECVWTLDESGLVHGCLDPFRDRALAVFQNNLVLFDIPSGRRISEVSLSGLSGLANSAPGPAVAFNPDDDSLHFLGADSVLYRWDIGGGYHPVIEAPRQNPTIELERDEYSFEARDGREVAVQRYLPTQSNGRAVVLMALGTRGEIQPQDAVALRLSEEGYEVLRLSYLAEAGPVGENRRLPSGLRDAGDALDAVDCGLDWRERFQTGDRPIAVVGGSYGGYLALMAMTDPQAPWSCGVTLGPWTRIEQLQPLMHSATSYADKVRFPLLILHPGLSTMTPTEDVESIRDGVRRAGWPCDLVVFEQDTHGLVQSRPEVHRRMLEFLDRYSAG